tara:strand:+ start:378 stop:704 length:327 start_codon:yes stop_codon:yes gene_type:complete
MFKNKKFLLIIILLFTYSCGDSWDDIKRGLTGQKQRSTDEFLIKKKDPLVLPPDYENLPLPGERQMALDERTKIEKALMGSGTKEISDSTNTKGSVEEQILNKIKKKK